MFTYINNNAINNFIKDNYNNYPFEHIVIDNFINEEYLGNIVNFCNNIKENDFDFKKNKVLNESSNTYNKFALMNFNKYNNLIKNIFTELNNSEFIDKIEELTGINYLVKNNSSLFGAGIHKITNSCFLNLHTDFNNYKDKNLGSLDRRINILIYLNENWEDEYNGNLLLADKETKKIIYSIKPKLNRCVIFSTTNRSIHGHPEKLNTPSDISRISIANYYYTKNINKDKCFEGDKFHSTIYYKYETFDKSNITYIY